MKAVVKIVAEFHDPVWRLYSIHPYIGRAVAGWRMAKGGVFPIDRFEFDSQEEAEDAALKLEEYVNEAKSKLSSKERKMEILRRRVEAMKAGI